VVEAKLSFILLQGSSRTSCHLVEITPSDKVSKVVLWREKDLWFFFLNSGEYFEKCHLLFMSRTGE
jgi:hypothetical protein